MFDLGGWGRGSAPGLWGRRVQRGHCQAVGVRLARRIVNLRLRLESALTLRAMLQSDHIFIYEIQPRAPSDLHRYEVTCTRTISLERESRRT